jgi:hypothetical protein
MHGMLKLIIVMRVCFTWYWHAPETVYDSLPQVVPSQEGQVGVDLACGGGKVLVGAQEQSAEHAPMLVGTRILSWGSQ